MPIKRNYRKKIVFNPLSAEFDSITTPKAPVIDDVINNTGSPISALRIVYMISDSEVALADPSAYDTSNVAGVVVDAIADGSAGTIIQSGVLTDSSWSWIPGEPLFLSASGIITQTPPTTGYSVIVGTAINATTMQVKLDTPLCL